jgi:peptide deformylase
MAILQVLHYPDPRLQKVAQPVTRFDAALAALVDDMADTMYSENGVGLAASQVDQHLRVIVVDASEDRTALRAYINPEIIWRSNETRMFDEGCLSVPQIYDKVERTAAIKVRAYDVHGQPFEVEAEGLLAQCIQHEMDHLDGTVFVDHLSPLKRNRIKDKLAKERRAAKASVASRGQGIAA